MLWSHHWCLCFSLRAVVGLLCCRALEERKQLEQKHSAWVNIHQRVNSLSPLDPWPLTPALQERDQLEQERAALAVQLRVEQAAGEEERLRLEGRYRGRLKEIEERVVLNRAKVCVWGEGSVLGEWAGGGGAGQPRAAASGGAEGNRGAGAGQQGQGGGWRV